MAMGHSTDHPTACRYASTESPPTVPRMELQTLPRRTSGTGRLDGKVAIVTGATGGIGRSIVRRFSAEGAQLVLSGRRDRTDVPAGARYVRGDVTSESHAEALA